MLCKGDITQQIAQRTGMPKAQAARALDAVLESVQAAVAKGEQVRLSGFGSFRVTDTKARQGRNPRTGAAIKIKAARVPKFRAGKALKDSVN